MNCKCEMSQLDAKEAIYAIAELITVCATLRRAMYWERREIGASTPVENIYFKFNYVYRCMLLLQSIELIRDYVIPSMESILRNASNSEGPSKADFAAADILLFIEYLYESGKWGEIKKELFSMYTQCHK